MTLDVEDDLAAEVPPDWVPIVNYQTERLLSQTRSDLVVSGCSPMWVAVLGNAFCAAGAWIDVQLLDLITKADQDHGLQLAIASAFRTSASAFAILDMVISWSQHE